MKKGLKLFTLCFASLVLASCSMEDLYNAVVNELEPSETTPTNTTVEDDPDFVLSSHSKTLTVGASTQLTVKTTLEGTVNWATSNEAVATVSNGLVNAVSVGDATITASLGDKSATCAVTVKDNVSWTIMIYMCGSDLESGGGTNARNASGLATGDIKEILKVAGQPEDVNIIIQTGGAKVWKTTYGISSKNLERWHVANKSLVKDASLTYASMGLASTFESFLEWGLATYPADKTGVIMWNHGGGMTGVCFDEKKSDDSLLNSEVNKALSNVFTKLNRTEKLEFIGYDACLMQVQDIAEYNSKYFNYMVAAEESEAGDGWDYDNWVDDLYAKRDTEDILKEICDTFIADNDTINYANDQTLSVLDLSKIGTYREAFENLATALGKKITTSNKSSFGTLLSKVKMYAVDDSGSNYYYGLYDVKDFLTKLSSNSTFNPGATYIDAVKAAFNDLVIYSKIGKDAGNSNGLCLCWGITSDTQEFYIASETNFKKWQLLSDTYGGTESSSSGWDDWGGWSW